MNLTERDRKLLLDIQDYGLLPTKLISSRHFDGIALSTVLRRLRLLESGRFIQRIDGLENGSNAWCLNEKVSEKLFGLPAKTSYPRQIVDHDLNLVRLRMRLEEVGIARAWIPEHVIRKRMAEGIAASQFKGVNVPDGLMGAETAGSQKMAYAIELEMTAKSQMRYRDIFRQYQQRRDLQGYWYVVQRPTIGRQLMTAAQRNLYGESAPYLMWSVLDEVLSNPMKAIVHGQAGAFVLADMLKATSATTHAPAQLVST